MKTGQEVIRTAKQGGTDSLAFHIAVEEMALQRDMVYRALDQVFSELVKLPDCCVSVALMNDMESALAFCKR